MAVIGLNAFAAAPGKLMEAIGLLKEAQEIVTGFGAQVQVISLVSGGTMNSLAVVTEQEDFESYGAGLETTFSDSGYQGFVARAVKSEALIPTRSVIYGEIPGLEVPFADVADSGVMMATVFKIRDGKLAESIDRIGRAKAIVEKHGGKMRALTALASDPFGLTATPIYYPNLKVWGKAGQALSADPKWIEFQAEMRGPDASSEFLRTSLYRIV